MTTTPDDPDNQSRSRSPAGDAQAPPRQGAPGAEIGVSEDEGSTFEPEEDAEAQR